MKETCVYLDKCEFACLPKQALVLAEDLRLGDDSILKACKIQNYKKYILPNFKQELQQKVSSELLKDLLGDMDEHKRVACVVELMREAEKKKVEWSWDKNIKSLGIDEKNFFDIAGAAYCVSNKLTDDLLNDSGIETHEKIYGIFIALAEGMEIGYCSEVLEKVLEKAEPKV